jgi:selT/selW/selH-like putative selenoprotein
VSDCCPQVNVNGEATPNVSGALEVVVESKGVVHSKKGGDGYVDTPEKMQKIKDAVKSVVG